MKTKHIALALALSGFAIATERVPTSTPHPEALQAIQTQIVARLERSVPPFSRVKPPPPEIRLHQFVVVDGEKRLPFEVLPPRGRFALIGAEEEQTPPLVSGYVRKSDNTIFVFNSQTQTHIPAAAHPHFAPQPTTLTTHDSNT